MMSFSTSKVNLFKILYDTFWNILFNSGLRKFKGKNHNLCFSYLKEGSYFLMIYF